jgi:hypothetical protein
MWIWMCIFLGFQCACVPRDPGTDCGQASSSPHPPQPTPYPTTIPPNTPHNTIPPPNTHQHSSEADAAAFLSPPGRAPLPPGSLASLPPCLSPWDSARVQAEAKANVERAKEELRRYRVRHEMLLRGKEAEIKQVGGGVGWEVGVGGLGGG